MKININNFEKINSALEKVEQGCSARLLSISHINSAVRNAEKQLEELRIPKKYWKGSDIYIDPEKVCSSYHGTAQGTFCRISRFASGWFMVSCGRSRASVCSYGDYDKDVRLSLSKLSKDNIPEEYKL